MIRGTKKGPEPRKPAQTWCRRFSHRSTDDEFCNYQIYGTRNVEPKRRTCLQKNCMCLNISVWTSLHVKATH